MILMKPSNAGPSVCAYGYDSGNGVYKFYAEINENSPSEILASFFIDALVAMKYHGGRIKLYVDFKVKESDLQDIKKFMKEISGKRLDNMDYWYLNTGRKMVPDLGEYDLHEIISEIRKERGE